jgi:methionine-S-sulfoxide reductase
MSNETETAILAGGCFWGMQDLIRKRPGVVSSRVGYTGGEVENATYRNHEGHAEAIEIVFDPAVISYRDLLEFFFQIHDPTTVNRQGNDRGTSYRSAIFYTSDEQRKGRRGHDRRCRRVRPVARQGGHGGHRGRPVLGGRTRAPGLPRTDPQRVHVPLRAPRLEAASPRRSRERLSRGDAEVGYRRPVNTGGDHSWVLFVLGLVILVVAALVPTLYFLLD